MNVHDQLELAFIIHQNAHVRVRNYNCFPGDSVAGASVGANDIMSVHQSVAAGPALRQRDTWHALVTDTSMTCTGLLPA